MMSFDRNLPTSITMQEKNGAGSHPRAGGLRRVVRAIPDAYIIPLSGGLAGAISGVVTCPLDVIKTKLQAQGGFQSVRDPSSSTYRGVSGTAATILKEDGVRGMYRGLGPMLLGYVPTWAVYLTVYNKSQAFFRTKTGKSSHGL